MYSVKFSEIQSSLPYLQQSIMINTILWQSPFNSGNCIYYLHVCNMSKLTFWGVEEGKCYVLNGAFQFLLGIVYHSVV
jgi:hypothetical protein